MKYLNLCFPGKSTDFTFLEQIEQLQKLRLHTELDDIYSKGSKPPALFGNLIAHTTNMLPLLEIKVYLKSDREFEFV